MNFLTGSTKGSWQPIMTAKTNVKSYWLNWKVLLCAIWLLFSIIFSSLLIWKYERLRNKARNGRGSETEEEKSATLYDDETWKPCLKGIHPACLMVFRIVAFVALLALLTLNGIVDGPEIFYYYTQCTFASITLYFGLGSCLSMYGCYKHHKKASRGKVDNVDGDAEKGMDDDDDDDVPALPQSYNALDQVKGEVLVRQHAGFWGYIFQIIFQINAGAVMLTDIVFWFVFVPFLTIKDYNLNFLVINMHSINAVFLIIDTALNSLPFPWFRMGYFCLWTATYVIFQWIVHACINLWWPYPLLDLSSSFAPLWYIAVGLLHIPCYGIFALLMKLKHHVLSTRYPDSYQCVRR